MQQVTPLARLGHEALQMFRRLVAKKKAGIYYVIEYRGERLPRPLRDQDPLYTWWVGEGFRHSEGWWIPYGDE